MFFKMDAERYHREGRDDRIKVLKARVPNLVHRADEKINYRLV